MPAAGPPGALGVSPASSPRSTIPARAAPPLAKPLSLPRAAGLPSPRIGRSLVRAGAAEAANARWRPSMEDVSVVTALPCGGAFLGVYDGHGGSRAAELSGALLHEAFGDAIADGESPGAAFCAAYLATDAALRRARQFTTGAAAVTAYVCPGGAAVTVANAGDARAVLVRADGGAHRLSRDHRPCDLGERARVLAAGAFVCGGRVNGVLGVSRALGDHAMKSAVSAMPHVASAPLGAADAALVLACDGLWDVVSDADAAAALAKRLAAEPAAAPHALAQALVDMALAAGSTDNVSVVVAVLDR